MHGGTSTGPRTPEGLERCRTANWKHGFRAAAAKAEQRRYIQLWHECKALLEEAKLRRWDGKSE
jgi:hypothetical protein